MLATGTTASFRVDIFCCSIIIFWNVKINVIIIFFSQAVRVTATLPDEVPSYLTGVTTGPQDWHYGGKWIWKNGTECSPELPNTTKLHTNQAIGLLISSDAHLHLYINGHHTTTVSGLPVNHHLWGAVDVKGNCTKIKSELLSGELDGVYMCLYSYFICCLATHNSEALYLFQEWVWLASR